MIETFRMIFEVFEGDGTYLHTAQQRQCPPLEKALAAKSIEDTGKVFPGPTDHSFIHSFMQILG